MPSDASTLTQPLPVESPTIRPLHRLRVAAVSRTVLRIAAVSWVAVALVGQLLMAVYVIAFYGRHWWAGQPERWNDVLGNGHIPGDATGNAVLLLHLAFVAVIVLAGAMQLLPALRRRAPVVHRWTGRVYLFSACLLALGGLHLVWRRGESSNLVLDLGVSLNALLILVFAVAVLHFARAGRTVQHRRWALRLFLAVSGVWFFRVGLMAWLILVGPVGFDPASFRGPFLSVLAFAQSLLPLAVLEVCLRAEAAGRPQGQWAAAGLLWMATALTAVGIAGAGAIMWWPRLAGG
jgi:hypothetical protein